MGYDLVKDLVYGHKGVIGCREPPRKVTVNKQPVRPADRKIIYFVSEEMALLNLAKLLFRQNPDTSRDSVSRISKYSMNFGLYFDGVF